ncbi:NADH-quinone oxidoreductase subunit L [Campylobacter sp. FMV-PI01]|uniref:NADH-quinone oxidoreductase subunit L n=1 Tax=Campylobacter portucalensis TaxID=2608384 RepID=A0A6L5WH51_9BACT|nr:NADH-quinone oxidoreductase subunit L [Campylobacter portucalensis]MSN95712.1 NADH-quinone oxidoreductase subunit L [Campylobacter portucalensis]
MIYYVLVSLFAPLFGAIFAGIFSGYKKNTLIGVVCSFLIIISMISSFILLEIVLNEGDLTVFLNDFMSAGYLNVNFSLSIDPLSTIMMVTVGIVASVVHIYSIGYMDRDEKFNKFFSFLGLFVFSMLILVMSDNFVGLFIGWEGVGLCSWLLIGFWYDKSNFSWCANEAFIMNRIADLGLLMGIFLIYSYTGSLNFDEVFLKIPNLPTYVVMWMGVFLFIGAMGKSAQFPLHTWLADAMAGPTPVSALIHAATMVTAGVYLVVRANEIFSAAIYVSEFIVILGAFVAIFAASMALVCDDLKKIIAYSTLSQLGYMFVAAGLGVYHIAIFHLVTHAFFKSLLFLCAGNIMHAMNDELDIKKMGGLYKFMKPTAILMVLASLALVGFYPFSGFFSKDKILESAFASGDYFIWVVLLIGALMTAFYSFRIIMLVFFGKSKFNHHPHEAKSFMLIALIPLAFLAVFAGFSEGKFNDFILKILPKFDKHVSHSTEIWLIILTLFCISLSTLFAIFAYKFNIFKQNLELNFIYRILKHEYFIPKFYKEFLAKSYVCVSEICASLDRVVIDKSVDLIANVLLYLGKKTDKMQSENLSFMLLLMIVGFIVILTFAFIFWRIRWI